jgi:uncharacterized glyoxalase superfamily protein PhnB
MPSRPALAPSITVNDLEKTYDYFTQVLGFAGTGKMPGPDGQFMHAEVVLENKYGQARVMLGPKSFAEANTEMTGDFGRNLSRGPLGNGVVLYFAVPDVDKYHAFISSKGAIVDEPPTDQFWGDRTISVLTPDGYYLTFSSPIKGFKWPAEALASISDARKATAPAAKTPTEVTKTLTAAKAKAKKSKK